LTQRRVVITGMGAITPLGLTVADYWRGLAAGRCAIGPITRFDAARYPVKVAAEVKNFEPIDYMDIKRVDRTSLCTQYAIAAAHLALADARLDMTQEKSERAGLVVATSGAMDLLIDVGEVLGRRGPMRVDPLLISKVSPSMTAATVAL
jgi:3-oxoacyl-[acyl-carrier-protein] synthase II